MRKPAATDRPYLQSLSHSFTLDVAIFCPTHAEAMVAKTLLAQWLAPRGLRWSEAKTHIRHLTEGFDFLGFHIRHYPAPNSSRSGYKLLIIPSTGSITQIKRKLKGLWRRHVGSPTVALINAMNPVIRGWSNYFRTGVASKVFTDLDNFMYYRAQRYMKRRHPRKSGWWRTTKYWGHTIGPRQDRWVLWTKCVMPPSGNSLGRRLYGIGSSPQPIPPMIQPYRITGDSDGPEPMPRHRDIASSFNGKRDSARVVTNTWRMARKPTYTM